MAMDEERSGGRLQVRTAEALQINEALRSNDQGQVCCGHWHQQPSDSLPSDLDIDAWRHLRSALGLDSFIGVVVRERLVGGVDVRGFVIDQDDILESARLEWRN